MILAASTYTVRDEVTIEQQVFVLLALAGLAVAVYYLTRGAVLIVVAVGYVLWGVLVYTARLLQVIEDAHYRGVARVRRYEARQRSTVDP